MSVDRAASIDPFTDDPLVKFNSPEPSLTFEKFCKTLSSDIKYVGIKSVRRISFTLRSLSIEATAFLMNTRKEHNLVKCMNIINIIYVSPRVEIRNECRELASKLNKEITRGIKRKILYLVEIVDSISNA